MCSGLVCSDGKALDGLCVIRHAEKVQRAGADGRESRADQRDSGSSQEIAAEARRQDDEGQSHGWQ